MTLVVDPVTQNHQQQLFKLPHEIYELIFEYLDYKEIFKLATTCNEMYNMISKQSTATPFVLTPHNWNLTCIFPQRFATHCKVEIQSREEGFSEIFKTRLHNFNSVLNIDVSASGALSKRCARLLLKDVTRIPKNMNLYISTNQAMDIIPLVMNKSVYTSRKLYIKITVPRIISGCMIMNGDDTSSAQTTTTTKTATETLNKVSGLVTKVASHQNHTSTTTATSNEAGVSTTTVASLNESHTRLVSSSNEIHILSSTVSTTNESHTPLITATTSNETHTSSTLLPLRRRRMYYDYDHLNDVETPDNIRKNYYEMKELAWKAGVAKRRRINTNTVSSAGTTASVATAVPLSAVKIVEDSNMYIIDDTQADFERMPPNASPISFEQANGLVDKYASQYLESIIMFDDYFLNPISIDVYWHNDSTLDDCADAAPTLYEQSTKAIIKEHKATTGAYYYESSIKIGYLELVVTGGFVGNSNYDKVTPFLGSSITCLPSSLKSGNKEASAIKRRMISPKYISSNRHLRQYSKIGARYKWSFQSSRFVLAGLYPLNPLVYCNHFVFGTTNKPTVHTLSAAIINAITSLSITKGTMRSLLRIAKKLPGYKDYMEGVESFDMLQSRIDNENTMAKPSRYKCKIVECLRILERVANEADGKLDVVEQDIRVKGLELMNCGYNVAVTHGNQKACDLFAKNHPNYLSSASITNDDFK
ncbi:hypothetical protein INT45_011834 [Circinella minor]|uniref:F-box domain-containing protein n=1 Tax=Circinella minor TaxID=1195481 RepID=A0A8H7VG96_9FUNG|nr:hypothetical protein INT45_011834 [Circinella minor]